MATYNTPLITTQGLSLLKAEIAGNDSVTFTKIVFSSDDYSQTADSSVQALTALSSLDLTATARSFTDVNGNLKIRGVANNQNTTSAFYIKSYGLYGKNNAGNEILIAVATTQNANFVPAYNGKQTNQIAYTFNIAISSTNNITLSSSTDVSVTQADIASINSAVNSNASSLSSSMSSISNSLSSSIANNSSAISNATSLASTANSNAVGAGLSVQTLESDTFRFQGKISNSNLDVSNYQNGVSNGWWSLSGVTINGLSGFSGYGIMSRTSDIYNITSNSGSQSATYVQVQVIDSINETIYYNIFSYSKWVGWKQVATADGTLQFMGAVPGNTLSQVVNSGIYDLQGRSFTDYTNNIWGQLIVTVTGGVVNQTIRNNTGNMWIESVNGWGISGWKQVV